MMLQSEVILLVILVSFILYSLLFNIISKKMLTLPIVFVAVGYSLSGSLDHWGTSEQLYRVARVLAEITLILVLFSDASHIRIAQLKRGFKIPMNMLLLGMPMTIALGMVVTYFFNPESGLAMALLTAAILTPTDAALGQTVVSNSKVPSYLSQSINVESGLNDGLALPFILLGAILTTASMGHTNTEGLVAKTLTEVTLGPLVGIVVGWFMAKMLDLAQNRNWCIESGQAVIFLATAFMVYSVAELVGGNGFISAFVAGAVFGNTYKHDIHFITEFMEGVGQILTMLAFIVFGALLLPDGLRHMSWPAIILALCFLTFIRMLPIGLSLLGTKTDITDKLFLGWFGPRGLASILFTLIIIDEFELPNEAELLACVSMTVFLSIMLHGMSSMPLARWASRKKELE